MIMSFGSGVARSSLVLVIVLSFVTISAAAGEEYWQTWMHSTDAQTFDGEAFAIGELAASVAWTSANYFAVARDAEGQPLEAVQMLNGKPNFHYLYWYDSEGGPLLRRFEYWSAGAFHRMSEVLWSRDKSGALLSVGYYVWPAQSPEGSAGKLQALKVFAGANFMVYDYRKTTVPVDREAKRNLDAIRDSLRELERLQKRNILQKLLGW